MLTLEDCCIRQEGARTNISTGLVIGREQLGGSLAWVKASGRSDQWGRGAVEAQVALLPPTVESVAGLLSSHALGNKA